MVSNVDIARTDGTAATRSALPAESIDFGFRWIDDITVKFEGERTDAELQLKISADIENEKYEIRKSTENTVRRVSNEKIPCDKTKEIVVELFEYRRKFKVAKRKFQIFSKKIMLRDDELYTEKTYRSDDNRATITLIFAYTPGGKLRNQVEKARRITEEQKVVLDKIRHVHRFFQGLEILCEAVEDIHPYIKAASTAILSLYKLCDKQKECRDAVRSLVDEMGDLLSNGVERLSDVLRAHSNTKTALRSITGVIEEISEFAGEHNKGMAGSLSDALFSKTKIEDLSEKLRRAKGGLNDSITYGLWELALDDHLKNDLKFVPNAYYQRGAGCLPGTRVELLAGVDVWIRDPCAEKMAWVYGYAGSGKSALLSSIARNLEKAYIPFTCFTCKRDDADCSDVQRILPTICYDLTRYYGNYRGTVSNVVKQPEGRSITTGDVATQMELLFGESPSYGVIAPKRAQQPRVHVILIDALDECKDIRERSTLAWHLRDLANRTPWIKVIISSRREPDIVDVLADTTQAIHRIDINDGRWKTPADIRLFIEERSKRMKLDLSIEEIDLLQEKASGLFVWCTTVFRYIEGSKRSKEELINDILHSPSAWPRAQESPFDSLYELYYRVLDSAVINREDGLEMESVLGVIFVASTHQPLSANAIADILYPSERGKRKRIWVTNIIESLFAIVYIEEGTMVVRTCHPSVLDFTGAMLTGGLPAMSSTGNPFSVKLDQAHAYVFEGCLSIMDRDLRFNICELDDSFHFNKDISDLSARITKNISEALQYGSLFWISHLQKSGLKEAYEKVLGFLSSPRALFWMEALSLLDVVDQGIVALHDCARFFAYQPRLAHLADEWERFLLICGDALESTPHLYLSALSWIPSGSLLWDLIHAYFSPELPFVWYVPEAWNGGRWSESVGTDVKSVTYSANGRLFAAGCWDGSIRFWEAPSGKKAREQFIAESPVVSIAFSPNNCWLASAHRDGKVRLWNFRANLATPRVLEGHSGWVRSIAFSSDGARIVSGSHDKFIRIWDVESGTIIESKFQDEYVTSVTFSADDTRIVSGLISNEMRIWNTETGEQIGGLKGHSVSCSHDGRFIASTSADNTIYLWDAETYARIGGPLRGHTSRVYSVCFSLDSRYLASGSDDNKICVWSIETSSLGLLVCELRGHTNTIMAVAFSPDGRNVLSGSLDGTIRVWDVKENVSVNHPLEGNKTRARHVSYVPKSNLIVSCSSDARIYLWDSNTGAAVGKPMQGHLHAVSALAVSGDGQWIVSGSDDHTLRVWDIASGTTLGPPILGHTENISSVAVSPDNRLIASASCDKTIRIWDVKTHELLMILDGHEEDVTSVAFSTDGNNVISGSWDRTVRIWDSRTGKAVGKPLEGHSDYVPAVSVSPDGHWIASSSGTLDRNVRIWSTSTLSVIRMLEGHTSSVTSLAFSPNSRYLISGSRDSMVRVWDTQTGEAVGSPLTGHTSSVNSVSFAPDGNAIASASNDGTVRVWDIHARTDIDLTKRGETAGGYPERSEEDLRVHWNKNRADMVNNDGWVRGDGGNLLLWVPLHYRPDINGGTKLVIGAQVQDTIRPQVNYQKMFKFGGVYWENIYAPSR